MDTDVYWSSAERDLHTERAVQWHARTQTTKSKMRYCKDSRDAGLVNVLMRIRQPCQAEPTPKCGKDEIGGVLLSAITLRGPGVDSQHNGLSQYSPSKGQLHTAKAVWVANAVTNGVFPTTRQAVCRTLLSSKGFS